MSGVSRRSLLGYSGSAAAGAVLASAGAAHADDAAATDATAVDAKTAESATAAVEFAPGTEFSGRAQHSTGYAEVSVTFSIKHEETPAQHVITPTEVAEALNDLAVKRGWPRITFYGTPPKAPLN
ncbi:hypothetical protein [Streptomyces sp. G45]|uniref:hypothetical protein n=1 Tax=Streptomyces sp. G45 TaxID=3406627 RepID=UPI003C1E8044